MKRSLVIVALALVTACSHGSSPTEPSLLASLNGQVQLCGFDTATVLTVVDAKGGVHTTGIDALGNYSFPQVLALGAYKLTATRPPLASKSINGDRLLVTGVNQEFWISLVCPTLTVGLNADCTGMLVSATGTATEAASGWQTGTATLTPPTGSVTWTLANPGTYHILFNGTYLDGRKPQWKFDRDEGTFGTDIQLLDCPATFLRGGTNPSFR